MDNRPQNEMVERIAVLLDHTATVKALGRPSRVSQRKARQVLGTMFHLPDDMLAEGNRVRLEGGNASDIWRAMLRVGMENV